MSGLAKQLSGKSDAKVFAKGGKVKDLEMRVKAPKKKGDCVPAKELKCGGKVK